MKPYYQDESTCIILGDCRDVLPTLGPVDLLLTDPPYGVGYQSGHRRVSFDRIQGDESQEVALLGIEASLKCLRDCRHLYVFGPFDLAHLPITSPVELIWDKEIITVGDLALPFGVSHEYIQFAVHVKSKANRATGRGRLSARLRKGSVLRHPRLNSRGVSRHPTEKPVPLLRELIESSSLFGETVLDPFMGIGSTLVAAALEGRKSIGVEIEEKY